MKHTYIAALAVLLTIATTSHADGTTEKQEPSPNDVELSFEFTHPMIGGFHGFENGLYWGIVVNTNKSNPDDFSALEQLTPDHFQYGIDSTAQWLTEDLLYFTNGSVTQDMQRFPPMGPPYQGALGTLGNIKLANPHPDGGFGNGYYENLSDSSFALIWFKITNNDLPEGGAGSIVPTVNDKYNFLKNPGFLIPSAGGNFPAHNFFDIDPNDPDSAIQLVASRSFVPEPASYALLVSGAMLAVCAAWQRKVRGG